MVAVAVSSGGEDGPSTVAAILRPGTTTWDHAVTWTPPAGHAEAVRKTLFGHEWALALPCFPDAAEPLWSARAILPGAGRAVRDALAKD
jgi:hypothetical protein